MTRKNANTQTATFITPPSLIGRIRRWLPRRQRRKRQRERTLAIKASKAVLSVRLSCFIIRTFQYSSTPLTQSLNANVRQLGCQSGTFDGLTCKSRAQNLATSIQEKIRNLNDLEGSVPVG